MGSLAVALALEVAPCLLLALLSLFSNSLCDEDRATNSEEKQKCLEWLKRVSVALRGCGYRKAGKIRYLLEEGKVKLWSNISSLSDSELVASAEPIIPISREQAPTFPKFRGDDRKWDPDS
ncbi:hypothetical protein BJV78DRAFT_1153833 [Lactifluus subvellereus]|nr:hypothetical protein BJV78DRAFT_1153833 [Lactifluus subvellereus]